MPRFPPATDLSEIKGEEFDETRDTLDHLGQHETHNSHIFPESTNLTVILTAHVNPDTWSAWAEIQDSGATTLSSKISSIAHICAVSVESTSAANETWMVEVAYGDSKVISASARFVSQSVGMLELVQFFRIRSRHIPSSETIYYRLMCSVGGETCLVHFRYFFV